jgi:hypothetical protein
MEQNVEDGDPLERRTDTPVPTEESQPMSDAVLRLCIALPVDEEEAAADEARILAEDLARIDAATVRVR